MLFGIGPSKSPQAEAHLDALCSLSLACHDSVMRLSDRPYKTAQDTQVTLVN